MQHSESEHRAVLTASTLMQTLTQHAAFINCTHSSAKKKEQVESPRVGMECDE